MKKTKFKNVDVTMSQEYRVICLEGDYKGKWTSDKKLAYDELVQHQRDTNSTHEVKIEVKEVKISSYDITQFNLLQ